MSAPDAPPDNSAIVNAQNIEAAKEAQTAQDAKDAQNRADLAQLRSGAATAASGSAQRYFADQGLDPSQYSGSIDDRINEIMGSIAPDDPNPGLSFKDVGQNVYNDDTTSYRNKESNIVNSLFPTNFDSNRITNAMIQPYEDSILGEQRGTADQYIQNLLSRGVITDAGKNAAESNLDTQSYGVKSKLQDLGANTLATGRQNLTDIANKAKSAAGTLSLGQSFDPTSYTNDADQSFNDFVSSLGSTLRGKLPGQLFDTSGLAAIAGAGSGAQNTKFDPSALAGVIGAAQPKNTTTDDTTQPVAESTF